MKRVRPTSPYLSIYKLQFGSLLSIYSRVTGIFLAFSLFFLLILNKNFSLSFYYYSLYRIYYEIFLTSSSFTISFFILILIVAGVYHLFSGLRFISWFSAIEKKPLHEVKLSPISFFTSFGVILISSFFIFYLI